MRALIVGNSGHTRATVRDGLKAKGWRVDMVDKAEQALAACHERKPDLLVVGTRLPTMDGYVFLTKLTGEGLAVPVILIGEPSEKGRAALAKQRGAGAFLINPIRVRELCDRAAELTSKEALQALALRSSREQERLKRVAQRKADAAVKADKAGTPRRRFKRKDLDGAPSGPGSAAPSTPGANPPRRFKRKDVVATASSPGAPRQLKRRRVRAAKPSPEEELVHSLGETLARMKDLDFHRRLELEPDAGGGAVARAFRKVAVRFHPDRYRGKSPEARRIAQDIYLLVVEAKNELSPLAEEPPAVEPAAEEPSAAEPAAEEPAAEGPPAEEPSAAEPSAEEPSAAEPAAAEPAAEEPSAEEPSAEEPSAEESPYDSDVLEVQLEPDDPDTTGEPSRNDESESSEEPSEGDEDALAVEPPDADEPEAAAEAAETDEAEASMGLPGAGRLPGSTPSLFNRRMMVQEAQRLAEAAEEASLAPFADAEERRATAMEALAAGRYRDAKNQLGLLVMHGHTELDLLIAQRLAQGHLSRVEGNIDEAAAQFEAALDLDPLDKGAREAKAALDEVHQQQDDKPASLLERLLGK